MKQSKVQIIQTELRGRAVLENSILNKGTAFSEQERNNLQLNGLLPDRIETLEQQSHRAVNAFNDEPDGLLRHINLRALQDTNETLFYATIQKHLKKMLPYIYTPVVGDACINFSTIFRRPRGLFLSWANRYCIDMILENVTSTPEVIIVTDGDRILGLGDLGMNGLGICIGKLSLYSGVGGIEPSKTLPIVLDVGTDNEDMLYGKNYLGWRHKRLHDEEYDEFINLFICAIKKKWPNVFLQFEDFSAEHGNKILKKYRSHLCCYNDDIQGTAAVVTGMLLAAVVRAQLTFKDLKIVIVGAGTAGCGIAEQVVRFFVKEGLSDAEIKERLYLVDKEGLLTLAAPEHITFFQRPYAQSIDTTKNILGDHGEKASLEDIVKCIKPNVLIGVTGVAHLFNETIVQCMSKHHKYPIIFPLSNPNSKSEAIPEHLIDWSDGKALVATGSPFDNVVYNNNVYSIAQGNNIYIFPAIGLSVKISGAFMITETMLDVAAEALASCAPEVDSVVCAPLLPFMESISLGIKKVALAVARQAMIDGVTSHSFTEDELKDRLERLHWLPQYRKIMAC